MPMPTMALIKGFSSAVRRVHEGHVFGNGADAMLGSSFKIRRGVSVSPLLRT